MTIWSYIVQIQSSQQSSNNPSSSNSSDNNDTSFLSELHSEAVALTSSTCSAISDDGGILLNILADLVVAGIIIAATVIAWVFWLNKEEERALMGQENRSQSLGSDGEETDPNLSQQNLQLVWYKAVYQIWTTSDAVVEMRQGIDGVRYIHLSEYLNILLGIITVLCVCIILPINLSGSQATTSFGSFCITNLDSSSSLLWAHYILAPLYLLLTLVIVWIYTGELGAVKLEEDDRVAIVKGADLSWQEAQFWNYFETKDRDEIIDIQLGYDVSQLYEIIRDREEVVKLHTRYKDLKVEDPEGDMTYNTGMCGCCGEEVEGLPHFTEKLAECDAALSAERVAVKSKRCNHVFVVWSTPGNCKMFINEHKLANICSLVSEQKNKSWEVRPAPFHRDINWENMSIPKWTWWGRVALINFILLLFVIFFTTPIMVVLALTTALDLQVYISSFYYIYITILLLIILTNILPEIVNWTCKLEKHRTKSGYYHWVLKKAFLYLLISVEILPLFGYNSIATWIMELFSDDKNGIDTMLSCMFSDYNLAFFCNLILAAALVGRSIELLQLKGIYTYIWERSRARTKREMALIFKSVKRSFNIGYNYAKLQTYLCIVITISLFCPLITIFGMFFMVVKFTVDKFLMVWRTSPCGSFNANTHYTSAYFTVFSAILLQVFMFLYAVIYIDISDNKTILSGIVLLIIAVFMVTKFGEWCYKATFPRRPDERDFLRGPGSEHLKDAYIPPVMRDERQHRKRTKRAYNNSKTYSISSLSALIDNGIGLSNNYKSISNKVAGSFSGRSIISGFLDSNASDPELATSASSSSTRYENIRSPGSAGSQKLTSPEINIIPPSTDHVTSGGPADVTSPPDDITSPPDDVTLGDDGSLVVDMTRTSDK